MDYHSEYDHRWHNPKVKSYESPIHELGVVAISDIKKGEVVFVYGGVIIPKDQIQAYWQKMTHVGIQIDDNFWICPTSREELQRQGVINHSCDPNVGFSNQVMLVSIRDIKAGEEITFDYAFNESFFESFNCSCGSSQCRKTITENDWKIESLQKKFGIYFSPYLRAKFSK